MSSKPQCKLCQSFSGFNDEGKFFEDFKVTCEYSTATAAGIGLCKFFHYHTQKRANVTFQFLKSAVSL